MTLSKEIRYFEKSCTHLEARIDSLSRVNDVGVDEEFLAEAVAFRLFRLQERLVRVFFLNSCVMTRSPSNNSIKSKLRCKDWATAEEILKAGNRFLDWGHPTNTKNIANLIFQNGYPVSDLIASHESSLIDLQRIRNYIAHDSREAKTAFIRTTKNYVRVGDDAPETAGRLLLYRKKASQPITLRIIFDKLKGMSIAVKTI